MATAKVSELFRAHCLADHVRERIVTRMVYESGEVVEEGMKYGQALVACANLTALLESCNLEVELPPTSEQFIGPVLEKIGWRKEGRCSDCGKPAKWVRRTQFSGSHFFCDECARQQKNFGQEDDSYFFWEKLDADETGTAL